jgi:hypothetical protein
MKKLGGLFLAALLLLPSLSFAQVATSSPDLKTQLIAALYAELAVLEQEIQQILTQQAQEASTTQQIISTQKTQSQQIQQIAQNTTPLFGSAGPSQPVTPPCTPNPSLSASLVPTGGNLAGQGYDNLTFSLDMGCPIADGTQTSWGLQLASGENAGVGIARPFTGTGSVFRTGAYTISLDDIPSGTTSAATIPLFLDVTVGDYSTSTEVQ